MSSGRVSSVMSSLPSKFEVNLTSGICVKAVKISRQIKMPQIDANSVHAQKLLSMAWNHLSIPKLQRLHLWDFGIG